MAMAREAFAWEPKFDQRSVLLAKQELGNEKEEITP
jgi:hypothetical protein